MNIWIELLTVIVEVFLPWYFFTDLFGKSNKNIKMKTLIGLVYFVVLSVLSITVSISAVRSLIIIVLTYLAAKFYFGQGWIVTLYSTALFFVFAIVSDILCGTLLQIIGTPPDAILGGGVYRIVYNSAGKFLHLLFLYIFLSIKKTKAHNRNIIQTIPLIICQIISIFICFYNYKSITNGNNPAYVGFESLGLLYINLVICAYVDALRRAFESENEAQLVKQQLDVQKNYYNDVLQRQEEARSLWHDIKKYMMSMETLINHDKRKEAQQCFNQIQTRINKNKNSIDTGNSIIDSIFTYELEKAAESEVTLNPDIWVDNELNIPVDDLFIIIGNTIENAIEACSRIEDKDSRIIYVSLVQKNHILMYEIRNPCLDIHYKKKGSIHGYGLKSVRACVERNNGEISISSENGMFSVIITLNIPD